MLETNIQTKIKCYQNNVDKNSNKMHTCLDLALKNNVNFVIIQESMIEINPHLNQEFTISHSSFYCFLSEYKNIRSQVAIFARKKSRFQAINRIDILSSNDILILEIIDKFKKLNNIQLINIYNEKSLKENENAYTIERELIDIISEKYSIICGDFNAHHSWWNSNVNSLNGTRAEKLVDWTIENKLNLLNEIDRKTFHRNSDEQPTVIDLIFVSNSLNEYSINWFINEETSGSNHELIQFEIELNKNELIENPILNHQYNFKNVDWEEICKYIENSQYSEKFKWDIQELNEESLKKKVHKLTNLILEAINEYIPKKKSSEYSKPWWNDEIIEQRKIMKKTKNQWQRNHENSSFKEYQIKRNIYFASIKRAKQDCWNSFLENAKDKDIFKAFQFTKSRRIEKIPILEYDLENQNKKAITFEEKCDAFMNTLFKKPPNTNEILSFDKYEADNKWEWPELSREKLKENIFSSSNKKAAGSDGIDFLIIQKLYYSLENQFYELYKNLLKLGFHPKCWRRAIGVILSKSNRKASNPKFYRVISLLNCLGKISEKIIANRLSFLISKHMNEKNSLLYHDQLEGRKQFSAIDAVMSLIHDIQIAKNEKLTTSVLFMDIKRAFDHVSSNKFIKICMDLKLSLNLIYWLRNFLSERTIDLTFDKESRELNSIDIEISQNSFISPILFLIYIKFLFDEKNSNVRISNYLDDIGLVMSSKITKENCQILKSAMIKLLNQQKDKAIQFDMKKTELIHFFSNSAQHERNIEDLNSNILIELKTEAQWLEIYLDLKLSFKFHINKKLSQTRSMLNNLIRLSNTERDLFFQAMRQLYIACISFIADYGIQIWWNNQKLLRENIVFFKMRLWERFWELLNQLQLKQCN